MARRSKVDMERSFYDQFARWDHDYRAAALKVLTILHDQLPAKPQRAPEPQQEPLLREQ